MWERAEPRSKSVWVFRATGRPKVESMHPGRVGDPSSAFVVYTPIVLFLSAILLLPSQ